jgi:hypothetical protein
VRFWSHSLSSIISFKFSNSSEAWTERGREKILSTSLSKKKLMELFCFLVKEKRCGNKSFKHGWVQLSCQNRAELPILGLQKAKEPKSGKSLIMSFHQKEPTRHLA